MTVAGAILNQSGPFIVPTQHLYAEGFLPKIKGTTYDWSNLAATVYGKSSIYKEQKKKTLT